MVKYGIGGFIISVILSGIIGTLIFPTYLNNQRMQSYNDGSLKTKQGILKNIDKYFEEFDGSEYEELLFSFKTTNVVIVKKYDSYT